MLSYGEAYGYRKNVDSGGHREAEGWRNMMRWTALGMSLALASAPSELQHRRLIRNKMADLQVAAAALSLILDPWRR